MFLLLGIVWTTLDAAVLVPGVGAQKEALVAFNTKAYGTIWYQ